MYNGKGGRLAQIPDRHQARCLAQILDRYEACRHVYCIETEGSGFCQVLKYLGFGVSVA